MYRLLEDLIIFSEGEGADIMAEMADLCREADSGSEDFRAKTYNTVRHLLKLSSKYGFSGNLWQSAVALCIAYNENPFSLSAERAEEEKDDIFARRDCRLLEEIFCYDPAVLDEKLGNDCFCLLKNYSSIQPLSDSGRVVESLRKKLCDSQDFFKDISEFYMKNGVGTLGLNKAFSVDTEGGKASFAPVRALADIRLSDLIGYQVQKEKLTGNTEAFLKRRPANNVLLFGDSGSGKSTSIKAIVNEFYDQGLRMIEIYKHQFKDLSSVIAQIKNRNYRFIIYMDDLSFEEFEIEYKYLKAVIEGGMETKPDNVLIYATSNRRHLIRETWSDRSDKDEELHRSDTVQEKLSLAARFGVSINYSKPTQQEYFQIVTNLAKKYPEITMSDKELCAEANKWELSHGGISGRTAQQFINYIAGKSDK